MQLNADDELPIRKYKKRKLAHKYTEKAYYVDYYKNVIRPQRAKKTLIKRKLRSKLAEHIKNLLIFNRNIKHKQIAIKHAQNTIDKQLTIIRLNERGIIIKQKQINVSNRIIGKLRSQGVLLIGEGIPRKKKAEAKL